MQVAYSRIRMPPALPPSPTLTNPDMILPYRTASANRWQQSSSSESSPETPRHPHPFENFSSIAINESRPTPSDSPEARRRLKSAGQSLSPFRNGILSRPGGPTRARSVTERERGADGRIRFENARLSYRPAGTPEKLIASSPTLRDEYSPKRVIIIEDEEQVEAPPESPLDSIYAPDITYKTPSILEEDEENPNSHLAMSKRAEEILANAKKRLTNMEGNLNRARSTLGSRPSSSMSSFTNVRNNESTPPHLLSNPTAKHRQTSSLDDGKPKHSRGLRDGSNADGNAQEDRLSIKNMDGVDAGRQWFWNGLTRTTSLAQRERYNALQPLREDGPAPEQFHRSSPAIPEEEDEDAAVDQGFDELQEASGPFEDFDSTNTPASGLTRARSTIQMREIRDQMQDLKGKISTLKQRARQDSLFRRSLQNLRTPSPFTAAEHWFEGVPLHEERTASPSPQSNGMPRVASPPRISPPRSSEELTTSNLKADDGGRDIDSGIDVHEQEPLETALPASDPPEKDIAEQNGIPQASIEQATGSEKPLPELPPPDDEEDANLQDQDSLTGDEDQYHETSTLPVGERHEDRPDAFDYEHFFLHSGMGQHQSGASSASRSSSRSSYSSVETTKPTDLDADTVLVNSHPPSKKSHIRTDSTDSTTSFTTAPSEEKSPADEEAPTPRTVVIIPARSDSLTHPQFNNTNGHHQKSHPSKQPNHPSRPPKQGTRPPSNSISSSSHSASALIPPHPQSSTASSSFPLLSYLAILSPNNISEQKTAAAALQLGDRDVELTQRLFQSLARVCKELEAIGSEEVGGGGEEGGGRGREDGDNAEETDEDRRGGEAKYQARMYRRKLDAARRVLDGEVNGEMF